MMNRVKICEGNIVLQNISCIIEGVHWVRSRGALGAITPLLKKQPPEVFLKKVLFFKKSSQKTTVLESHFPALFLFLCGETWLGWTHQLTSVGRLL